ncbi:hypothetical protein ABZ885_35055, partial [Kitasatospora sp. NPDC047058]
MTPHHALGPRRTSTGRRRQLAASAALLITALVPTGGAAAALDGGTATGHCPPFTAAQPERSGPGTYPSPSLRWIAVADRNAARTPAPPAQAAPPAAGPMRDV